MLSYICREWDILFLYRTSSVTENRTLGDSSLRMVYWWRYGAFGHRYAFISSLCIKTTNLAPYIGSRLFSVRLFLNPPPYGSPSFAPKGIPFGLKEDLILNKKILLLIVMCLISHRLIHHLDDLCNLDVVDDSCGDKGFLVAVECYFGSSDLNASLDELVG